MDEKGKLIAKWGLARPKCHANMGLRESMGKAVGSGQTGQPGYRIKKMIWTYCELVAIGLFFGSTRSSTYKKARLWFDFAHHPERSRGTHHKLGEAANSFDRLMTSSANDPELAEGHPERVIPQKRKSESKGFPEGI